MNSDQKPVELVTHEEEDRISRNVLKWLNTFPDIPDAVLAGNPMAPINFEFLTDDMPCMALSTVQGTYIVQRDIIGGYTAEYQFKVIYRIKPGSSMDKRLKADELLNQIGDWASGQRPDIGEGLTTLEVEPTTRSSLFGMFENGDEDHQIFMRLLYQVRPRKEK